MTHVANSFLNAFGAPDWVPLGALHYLAHTELGVSIRQLSRLAGCHASTVMRQVRRIEARRDDPLVDAALRHLGTHLFRKNSSDKTGFPAIDAPCLEEKDTMSFHFPAKPDAPATKALKQDMVRVLGRLCEKGAVLAVAVDMQKALVVRDGPQGPGTRTAVVDRHLAEVLALKEWIEVTSEARVTRYKITAAGRAALSEMIDDIGAPEDVISGMAEAPAAFAGKEACDIAQDGRARRMRYNLAESPLAALARRRDKDGSPFLDAEMVSAGERLREDFELAQMGPNVAQNWDSFLTGGARGSGAADAAVGRGPEAARARLGAALADLGPGLSDIVLRCCCYLEGLETAEKKLGWSARSGKIVLRIALTRLQRHFEEVSGPGGGMIG